MTIGRYRVRIHNHGYLRLDGGAMFGVIPKTMWSREAPADEENRIRLATRSLIVEDGSRMLMVDAGSGDKWTDKLRRIYGMADEAYAPVAGVTDLLFTHLHFDHVGGVSQVSAEGPVANYPDARHYVSRANLANAKAPNARERSSYLPENIEPLQAMRPTLLEDRDEVWPGIVVHRSDGHTEGMLWVTVSDGGETLAYPTDLCPTAAHLPSVYAMGYDMCAERVMAEKAAFLERAVAERWLVVFEHDPEVAAGRIAFDERGRPRLVEAVQLS